MVILSAVSAVHVIAVAGGERDVTGFHLIFLPCPDPFGLKSGVYIVLPLEFFEEIYQMKMLGC